MGGEISADVRRATLGRWIEEDLGFAGCDIAPASADASFRRYFRVTREAESFIVMDAPPGKEDLGPFRRVASLLAEWGLNVPIVLARNEREGLLLMTDLGSAQYLPELCADRDVERLYTDALTALLKMQRSGTQAGAAGASALPPYSETLLQREMQLMPEWFLEKHLARQIAGAERTLLAELAAILAHSALVQPRVFVHRDYHSRNLMRTRTDNPGILDFQDAVLGPVTYDLVSLLKDCYIAWPIERVRGWVLEHRAQLTEAGIGGGTDEREFLKWFDLMGLQRHIKVLGIFARLFYRDGKSQYLHDLPRVFAYVHEAAERYPETAAFGKFLARIEPDFKAAQARVLGAA